MYPALIANIDLADDNVTLKEMVIELEEDVKGLATRVVNNKTSTRQHAKETERLKATLVEGEKERNDERLVKEQIEQKAFNDVNEAHDSSFQHCLQKVLFHCDVLDAFVFDINKDVYN